MVKTNFLVLCGSWAKQQQVMMHKLALHQYYYYYLCYLFLFVFTIAVYKVSSRVQVQLLWVMYCFKESTLVEMSQAQALCTMLCKSMQLRTEIVVVNNSSIHASLKIIILFQVHVFHFNYTGFWIYSGVVILDFSLYILTDCQ